MRCALLTHIHHVRERLTASVCTGPRCPLALLTSGTSVPSPAHGSCPPAGPTCPAWAHAARPRPGSQGESTLDPEPPLHGPLLAPCPADPKRSASPTSKLCLLSPVGPACPTGLQFPVPEGELQPGQDPGQPRGTPCPLPLTWGVRASHRPSSMAEHTFHKCCPVPGCFSLGCMEVLGCFLLGCVEIPGCFLMGYVEIPGCFLMGYVEIPGCFLMGYVEIPVSCWGL